MTHNDDEKIRAMHKAYEDSYHSDDVVLQALNKAIEESYQALQRTKDDYARNLDEDTHVKHAEAWGRWIGLREARLIVRQLL